MTAGQIFEITSSDELVWDYVNPVTNRGVLEAINDSYPTMNAVYRALRYGADHPALAGKILTAQGTIAALSQKNYFPWMSFDPSDTTAGIAMINPTSVFYSLRRACIGSIPEARLAGNIAARVAARIRAAIAQMMDSGSFGEMSKYIFCTSLVKMIAPPNPSMIPKMTGTSDSSSTTPTICARRAPCAMRKPISAALLFTA
jgi:hypothetical protein